MPATADSHAIAPTGTATPARPALDEVMLAMDIVDTLRHDHALAAEALGDRLQRQSDTAEPGDEPRLRQAVGAVPAVAVALVDAVRPEETELVVVPQRLRRHPSRAGEFAHGQPRRPAVHERDRRNLPRRKVEPRMVPPR